MTMDAIDVLGVAMRSIRQGNPGNAIDILADMQEQMRGIDWEADRKRIATLERERDEAQARVERLEAVVRAARDEVTRRTASPALIAAIDALEESDGKV